MLNFNFIFHFNLPKFINIQFKNFKHACIFWVSGPKGTLVKKFNNFHVLSIRKKKLIILSCSQNITEFYNQIFNSVFGVSKGYQVFLKIIGVGYKFLLIHEFLLQLKIGLSHTKTVVLTKSCNYKLYKKQSLLEISGISNNMLALHAAIRSVRKPDIYKGKGILFYNEVIKLKAGKKDIY
jgi:large subunit ribosomal protein L6